MLFSLPPCRGRVTTRCALGVGLGLLLASCTGPEPAAPTSEPERLNVLVITLDTIRTDRLGAYGNTRVTTDFVDGLARRGVTFDRCVAPTPLTLPSHTSLFTGTYPVHHGVRDNGNYVVPAELTTMAELFSGAGYRTAAFVAAYVLSARWGLDQGFDHYTEPRSGFDPTFTSFAQIQRPADRVVDDALDWIGRASDRPFFAWVHLYDPHLPYEPPAPYSNEYADDLYLGEVAFADAQLGRVGAALAATGLADSTLIVFAGDHGEGLGDHGELDHGLLLYQTTARVPLIVVQPEADSGGERRPEVVSLVDVMPTIADLIGLETPERVQGQSLAPLLTGSGGFEERPVHAETHYPKLHFGWSPLTSLQTRSHQLIRSSDPELYDLEQDPNQKHNVIESHPELARRMEDELDAILERLGRGALDASSAPDAATIAKLAALGYVAGGAGADPSADDDELPSPRSMLWLYNRLMAASAAVASGDLAGGEAQLLEIVRLDDGLVDAWVALGRLYRRQGRMAESLTALRQAHDRRPLDPFLTSKLADALISTRRLAEADALVATALEQHPEDPYLIYARARIAENGGRFADAETLYRRSLTLDPKSAPTHVRLAALSVRSGDLDTAESHLAAALELDPNVPEAQLYRGQVLEARNRLDEAARAYRLELEARPAGLPAALALSRLEGRRGRTAEQERVLRDAIRANPASPGPYLVLALTLLQRNERLGEAVELAELGLEQRPQGRELQMAYILLADLHARLGEPELAADYAERAERLR